jgi:peptidoglycan-associated lipoprotein
LIFQKEEKMQKKFWICLALLLVVPGLLFTASCAKKTVKSDSSMTQEAAATESAAKEKQAGIEKQEELTRQQVLEEERLKEQRLREQRLQEDRRRASEAALAKEAARKAAADALAKFTAELVLFDYDSSVLMPTAQGRLQSKAAYLKASPNVKVIIEGHCDERGTPEYNLALGERRAEAAKAFLIDLGVSSSRLATISYGEERPFAMGHDESAWSQNRRAHFVVE